MQPFYTLLKEQMEEELRVIETNLAVQEYAAAAIRIIQKYVEELKQFQEDHAFETIAEEIEFFKYQAPEVYAKLIYYRKLYQIHTQNASANIAMQKKQLRREHKKIGYFYCANVELLSYYATGMQERDELLFTRKLQDILHLNDDYAFMIDTRICPLATYKIAKMKAYRRLENDILAILKGLKLQVPTLGTTMPPAELQWTASKIAITELIYGLYATSVFNSGQARLKEIVAGFEQYFKIDLNDYKSIYQDMKMRKKSRTSFLSELRTKLEAKMDDEEQ
ncbi:MAG: RteC domain-containing protein [Agriterribacter sp.]